MFFFFNDTATTEIYTLSLHDALPISPEARRRAGQVLRRVEGGGLPPQQVRALWALEVLERCATPEARQVLGALAEGAPRSEEHTSELQSRQYLVCRLLLEKKKMISGE